MISLKVNPYNNHIAFAQTAQNTPVAASSVSKDENIRIQADEAMKSGYFDRAIKLYKQALEINPENTDANLNLAKTYKLNSDFKNAIPYFEKACAQMPDDLEIMTLLGECYKHNGEYSKAETQFKLVLNREPNYDYAKRNLLDTENLKLACIDPQKAYNERQKKANENLRTAISLATGFLPKNVVNKVQDVTVTFDKTAQMGGRSNIAQYEHAKRKISIQDEYTYADPILSAAYTVHEFIHAADNDPYTSIREEQDAYRIQAKFWDKNAKNVRDPEMDYVVELYRDSAEALDKRVAEIYLLRDPGIPATSYNHPPGTKNAAASGLTNSGTTLKAYDIIV